MTSTLNLRHECVEMKIHVVIGPQGCGKTRNAGRIAEFFNADRVIEGEEHSLQDLLHKGYHLKHEKPLVVLAQRRSYFGVPVSDPDSKIGPSAFQFHDYADVMASIEANEASKPTNPKDAVGIRKWRYISTVPLTVMWEVGAALLEGARKYGRHNYRVAGVRASVYVDAAFGHIGQWWEGDDIDNDSGLNHITKAIASLTVLRDAMIQDMLEDDRPPKGRLDAVRADLQATVDRIFDQHPNAVPAYVEKGAAR